MIECKKMSVKLKKKVFIDPKQISGRPKFDS